MGEFHPLEDKLPTVRLRSAQRKPIRRSCRWCDRPLRYRRGRFIDPDWNSTCTDRPGWRKRHVPAGDEDLKDFAAMVIFAVGTLALVVSLIAITWPY